MFTGLKRSTADFREKIWHSPAFAYRLLRVIYVPLHFCRMMLSSSMHRGQLLARLKYRKHYHQLPNFTKDNRYPSLFHICKEYFKGKQVKILSFGCSTGEEVYSLHDYLPEATVVGVDISEYNLRECRKKEQKENLSFLHCLSETYLQSRDYDAVFCMAVLQHSDNQKAKMATAYTFAQFEEQLLALDAKLKPGGLFFIANSDFSFLQTRLKNTYFPLDRPGSRVVHDRPLFNSKNERVAEVQNLFRVFLKKGI
ncbi:MAG: class I SAM-dependent methyltransferase [Flavobacteriales bacterium]